MIFGLGQAESGLWDRRVRYPAGTVVIMTIVFSCLEMIHNYGIYDVKKYFII